MGEDGSVYEDVVQLLPAYSATVDMYVDTPGTWFYHCHVNDHVEAGMVATYTVLNETCTDCVGWAEAETVDEQQQENDVMSVLRTGDTWIIVVVSLVVNWIGMALAWLMARQCRCGTKGRRQSLWGTNGSLREPMLTEEDLELQSTAK